MADNGPTNSQTSAPPPEVGSLRIPKGIGSLVKKQSQSDVTRQGTQKLKFVPTLPSRRKKDEPKEEVAFEVVPTSSERGNARGRGRGRGREARGAAPRTPQVEMTASGPFAMGPALVGSSARHAAPRPNFTPILSQGPSTSSLRSILSNAPAPQLKKDKQRENVPADVAQREVKIESEEEVYSEPDDGVEIVDIENVGKLDWMAPETLQKEQRHRKKGKTIKSDIAEASALIGSKGKVDFAANGLDPSESEEESELEDLIDDFAFGMESGHEESIHQERLYLFQFPEPFPTFVSNAAHLSVPPLDVGTQGPSLSDTKHRRVSFAANVKVPESTPSATSPVGDATNQDTPKIDGIIGQLEVYRSGAVKMRLGNGILLNVSEATQASFLQHAAHLDMENKRLHIVGDISKRFVVSPDLDALLAAIEAEDNANAMSLDDPHLIRMDP